MAHRRALPLLTRALAPAFTDALTAVNPARGVVPALARATAGRAPVGGHRCARPFAATPARPAAALPQAHEGEDDDTKNPPVASPPTPTITAVAAHLAARAGAPPALDALTVLRRPTYTSAYLESVAPTAKPAATLRDRAARATIRAVRTLFDAVTGYKRDGAMTEAAWLRRTIFLETVAGVPGMVAGALRHLRSLRLITYDKGWINTLLQEAENERMHLLCFMEIRQPGPLFRATVKLAQGVMWNAYFVTYLINPAFCHAMVGFLEEEAVKTYTHALAEIDAGRLWADTKPPAVALDYWCLPDNATMRDVILAIRADEACHSHVNHTLSELGENDPNPFALDAHAEQPKM